MTWHPGTPDRPVDGPGNWPDGPPVGRSAGRRRAFRTITAVVAVVLVAIGLVAAAHAIKPAQRPTLLAAPARGTGAGPAGTDPTRRQRPTPPAPQITLAFAGDVHFEGRVAGRLADPASVFGPVSAVLSRADLAMVNLETAITQRGVPEDKQFNFRAPESALTALRLAGVDLATMANNHAVDYGLYGLVDTLGSIRRTRFPVIGIGRNANQAYTPYLGTVRGHRVAILAASQIQDHTLAAWTATASHPGIASAFSQQLVTAVRQARQHAEIVIVYLHWGVEGKQCPSPAQRQLAGTLAAAGADAVVGTHAHLLQGAGWLGPTYVAYGLGNFLWWRDNAFSNDTGVLTLTLRGRRVVASVLSPARIDARGVPVPTVGAQSARILAGFDRARGCTRLAAEPGA